MENYNVMKKQFDNMCLDISNGKGNLTQPEAIDKY